MLRGPRTQLHSRQLGDSHNFGVFVRELVSENGSSIIFKPRTVFWERLFFSTDSDLVRLLTSLNERFGQIAQLQVLQDSPSESRVLKILAKKSGTEIEPDELLEQFMALSAVCAVFGLQDMNVENLIVSPQGLVAVDVESPFHELIQLSNSGLFGNPGAGIAASGFAAIVPYLHLLDRGQLDRHLVSFAERIQEIANAAPLILELLTRRWSEFSSVPIRLILRMSQVYSDFLTHGHLSHPLMPEEADQLARGDIPYFFSYLGDAAVYFYASPGQKKSVARVPPELFQNLTERVSDPRALFVSLRLAETLFPIAMLEMTDHLLLLLDGDEPQSMLGPGYRVTLTSELISIETAQASWSMTRKFAGPHGAPCPDDRRSWVRSILQAPTLAEQLPSQALPHRLLFRTA